ncbi:HAD-like domain-containing protein, partial [Gorgonomyces haynaldii]
MRRLLHYSRMQGFRPHPAHVGFAFDIDGVLLRGPTAIPSAKQALELLLELKVPHIYLTNGGGVSERSKANDLQSKLYIPIQEHQMILSHTPMRQLAQKYQSKPVLIIGQDYCKQVALEYGFQKPVLASEILSWNHKIWPFSDPTDAYKDCLVDLDHESIASIMVFHDSRDWGRDCQIICDVLRSENGKIGTENTFNQQAVPVYTSNSDFIWTNEFPLTRFAQGAFRMSLEQVYHKLTGNRLKYTKYGKPERSTYDFARKTLEQVSHELWPGEQHKRISTVYMVGDNPASDVEGARSFGWNSALVKTGVWRGQQGHGATFVADNVLEAVKEALSRHGL